MSNHTNFIVQLVNSIKAEKYLELGLYDGETFTAVAKSSKNIKCTGVDIKDLRLEKLSYTLFHQMTTYEFFKINNNTFDVIFIDADHKYESVKVDFINALNVLNPRGVIILHDTDPTEAKYLQDGYCSNSYKMNDYLKERNDLMFITLPIGTEGLTLVKRFSDRKVLNFI